MDSEANSIYISVLFNGNEILVKSGSDAFLGDVAEVLKKELSMEDSHIFFKYYGIVLDMSDKVGTWTDDSELFIEMVDETYLVNMLKEVSHLDPSLEKCSTNMARLFRRVIRLILDNKISDDEVTKLIEIVYCVSKKNTTKDLNTPCVDDEETFGKFYVESINGNAINDLLLFLTGLRYKRLNLIVPFVYPDMCILPQYIVTPNANVKVVEHLIKSGVSPNSFEYFTGKSMLRLACEVGNIKIIRCLLDAGANAQEKKLLTTCARYLEIESFNEILKSTTIEDLDNLLLNAYSTTKVLKHNIRRGLEFIQMLFDMGASPDIFVTDHATALMDLASGGPIELVRLFLKNGATVNFRNEYNWNALFIATRNGHVEMVKELSKNNQLVSSSWPDTFLMTAAESHGKEMINLITQIFEANRVKISE